MINEQNRMGRGIVKWRPFASIPSQFAGVKAIVENQKKISQPILDEGEQERINYILEEALEYGKEITLVYWSKGYLHNSVGRIHKVDPIHHSFQFLTQSNQLQIYSFNSIVDIKQN